VPATVLAQVVRRPERQVRLVRLARAPTTDIVALDRVDATHVGRLIAASGTADIVDAHVVICANRAGQRVVTSDADDLARLDPRLQLIIV
jgi:predicted nucleic acid-binding protein